jgi:hypothetical protein
MRKIKIEDLDEQITTFFSREATGLSDEVDLLRRDASSWQNTTDARLSALIKHLGLVENFEPAKFTTSRFWYEKADEKKDKK